MAEEEERVNGDADSRAPVAAVAEGIEMTTVDLSSPNSPPAVRLVGFPILLLNLGCMGNGARFRSFLVWERK